MTNPDHAERLAQALRYLLEHPIYGDPPAKDALAAYESSKSAPQATNSCPVCDAREDGVTDEMVLRDVKGGGK